MTGATLFSGIGAPECAAPWIDWRFAAEIEHFPSAVLKARFPHVPNLGDVTAADFIERARAACAGATLDVLVFGSPCQSFSVAGKRLGINDPRGNLALHALGVVIVLKPRWFVFENVPGLLSSWSGDESSRSVYDAVMLDPEPRTETSDFASFLHAVAECGYSACWASPDAQWFGVAQRRERVFLVGHHRDWRGPAGVLSEFHRVPWDPPARGQSGEVGGVAGTLPARTRGGGGHGKPRNVIAAPILESGARTGSSSTDPRAGMGIGAEGDPMFTLQAGKQHALALNMRGREGGAMPEPSEVASVRAASGGSSRSLVAIDPNQITSAGNRSNPQPGDPCHTLPAAGNSPLITSTRLRRLTAMEVELLQGFPPHWTAIDYRRRRISAAMARYLIGHGLHAQFDARLRGPKTWVTRVANDTARYRAAGNSMAVPVLDYLLTRIREVDRLMGGKR